METTIKKLYEAMFLVDAADAASDWDGVTGAIRNILEKVDAEIVSLKKWDERRLAYEISKKSKGTYVLCYFKASGQSIQEIERSVQLSERIIRVLVLSAEGRESEVEKATPAESSQRREVIAQDAEVEQPEPTEADSAEKQDTEETSEAE